MKKTRLKAALHYQLDYVGWSVLIVAGIGIAVAALLTVLSEFAFEHGFSFIIINDVAVTDFNIAVILMVLIFVIGVGGVREDMRFFNQHGISRLTTYLSTLYGSLISALAIGLMGEVLNVIALAWDMFPVNGMFLGEHNFIVGWLLQAFCIFAAWQIGTFLSLLLYRMSKIQKIIFITAIVGLVMSGVRRFFIFLSMFADEIFEAYMPGREGYPDILLPMVFGVFGTLCAALNFLLIRRAPIKE